MQDRRLSVANNVESLAFREAKRKRRYDRKSKLYAPVRFSDEWERWRQNALPSTRRAANALVVLDFVATMLSVQISQRKDGACEFRIDSFLIATWHPLGYVKQPGRDIVESKSLIDALLIVADTIGKRCELLEGFDTLKTTM